MTTSGVTTWQPTARDFVTQALRERGALSSGEDPTADEMEDCLFRFNGILTRIGSRASALWREATGTFTVTANVPTVALSAGIREIANAWLVNSATIHRPLSIWARDDYYSLPNKASSGSPTALYLSKGNASSTAYVWPVPTANATIGIDYLRAPEIITEAGQTVDFPEDYVDHLTTILAERCWGLFREGDPPQKLILDAERRERELLDAGRPDSYFLRSECA